MVISACLLLLIACSKDDDGGPSDPIGDATLSYKSVSGVDFKMWVGSQLVSTADLEIADYMEPQVFERFDPARLSNGSVEFIGDSIRVDASFFPSTQKFPYRFSNDSLFVQLPFFGESYTAIGNKAQLVMTQSFVYDSKTIANGAFSYNWQYDVIPYTFENTESEHGYSSPSEIAAGDTVIVYNQHLTFGL